MGFFDNLFGGLEGISDGTDDFKPGTGSEFPSGSELTADIATIG